MPICRTNAFRLYTTLDMRLQQAAAEAIRLGMQSVDDQIKRQRRFRGQTPPEPQVALVALDPHTGEVKALAGGRNYGISQLNHVLAKRQPGSIFKPFVYAAAMDTAVDGGHARDSRRAPWWTTSPPPSGSTASPTSPTNFGHEFHGNVTLRDGAGAFAQRGHGEGGGDGGLRRGGGDGQPGRDELSHPADAGGGAGRL